MNGPPKKSFASSQQMLKSALKAINKYSQGARRGFLLLVEDNTGLHKFGTKNMAEKFITTTICDPCNDNKSWTEAARADTRDLNSEDIDDANVAAPVNIAEKDVIATMYENNEIPKLPYDVDLLSEKEARAWILPELKKDLVENGSRPVSRIVWGDENFHPKCWADEMVEWSKVSNLAHPQKQKHGISIVKVLHATIKKRLVQKGIDPKNHIDEKNDKNVEERKKKTRGLHKNNLDLEVPIATIDTESVQATRIDDATEEPPIFDENDTSVDNLEDIVGASEELDISVETDSDGRQILPSRCETRPTNPTITSSSPVEEDISALLNRSSSPPPIRKRKSLVSSLLPDPKRARRQESPNSDDHEDVPSSEQSGSSVNQRSLRSEDDPPSNWTRGRGKGGRNMRILRNRITNQNKNDQ